MKKFFSLIALVGVFAACQPEELTTVFKVEPAQLNINAEAKSAAYGFNPTDVVFSIPAVEANSRGVIEAGTTTVTATYGGKTLSNTVSYPTVYAGGKGTINTLFVFPYDKNGYTFEVVEESCTSILRWVQ